jgi:aspartyl protease family protein
VDAVRVLALFPDKALVEVDGQQRLLRAGQTSPEGIRLVSASSREAVLEIDGRTGTYTIGNQISTHYSRPAQEQARVQIWPDAAGMYGVVGSINGYPVSFIVDTGATAIALNAPQARRLGIDYRVVGDPLLAATASGVAQAYAVTLARVRVGDIELRDVRATVMDGAHPQEALLGMTFLGRVDMVREGQMLELRKRR